FLQSLAVAGWDSLSPGVFPADVFPAARALQIQSAIFDFSQFHEFEYSHSFLYRPCAHPPDEGDVFNANFSLSPEGEYVLQLAVEGPAAAVPPNADCYFVPCTAPVVLPPRPLNQAEASAVTAFFHRVPVWFDDFNLREGHLCENETLMWDSFMWDAE